MNTEKSKLSRLEKVELRSVWADEASEFTPWLARDANLQLLGDTIGVQLELEAQEKDVGPFRADILCRDVATQHWVLIENQLERTDHIHLGQLITYAAGLKAVTIIWVASRFTEEHRAALDWLNEITDTDVNFFGLEVELWQIGDSDIAPKFNVTSKPNDWTRTVSEAASRGELTEAREKQLKYWTAFRSYVSQRDTQVRTSKPGAQYWMTTGIGRSGFYLTAIAAFSNSETGDFSSHEVRVELAMHGVHARGHFTLLQHEHDAIESELGYTAAWFTRPGQRTCRIYVRREVDELRDETQWPELHAWTLAHLEDFRRVFEERVKALPTPEAEPVGHAEGEDAETS